MSARELATLVLLSAGTALEVFGLLGVVLLRDAFDRLHYVGVSSLAGVLMATSIVVRESFSLIGNKAILLAVFLLVSSPVLAHVTARAILLSRRRAEERG